MSVSLSRVSEGVKEREMAKIQWFWHRRPRNTEWNLGLVGPSEMSVLLWWCHSQPSLNRSGRVQQLI